MRGYLSVLRRELSERWLLAAAAALLGLVPLIVPLLPLGNVRGPDARAGTAIALALITSFVLALVLGSTVLARDLAERRLGFYFSRPLPGWAIWAGKLTAAVLLAFGSGFLILLPSLLLGDRPDPTGLALWPTAVLALLLFANAAGVMVRSRSPWLLLDLLAVTLLAVLVWTFAVRLLSAGAVGALRATQVGLLAAFVLSLAAASAAQVTRARTDLRRGHRVLSLTLWTLLGLSVLGFGGYTRWVLSASPEDLTETAGVIPAPAGDWVAVGGKVGGGRGELETTFLLDTSSGRSFRLDSPTGAWGAPAFSRDGRHAVWLQGDGLRVFPLTVHRLELGRPGAKPTSTSIGFSDSVPHSLSLSPDGSRLACAVGDRIFAHEVRTGRLLLAAPILKGEAWWGRESLRFLDSSTLRFYGMRFEEGSSKLRVLDFDLDTGRTSREVEVPGQNGLLSGIERDGHQVLLKTRMMEMNRPGFAIVDLRTEEPPVRIQLEGVLIGSSFLSDDGGDNRLAMTLRRRGRIELLLLDGRGTMVKRFPLPGSLGRLGGQPAPGFLVVATAPPALSGKGRERWRSELVDLERGTRQPLGEGLLPAGWPGLPAGSIGTKLFLQERGGLVLIDPATGRRRVILHPL